MLALEAGLVPIVGLGSRWSHCPAWLTGLMHLPPCWSGGRLLWFSSSPSSAAKQLLLPHSACQFLYLGNGNFTSQGCSAGAMRGC